MNLDKTTFEQIVSAHYESLYRFALSLTHREADACDLTQETIRLLAEKAGQIRDASKVKTWLFTTLYREFVDDRQREARFEEFDAGAADERQPAFAPAFSTQIDGTTARHALMQLSEPYRTPLVLFYLDDHSYREIADILSVPIGTIMSRISRGKEMLREALDAKPQPVNGKTVLLKKSQPIT